MMLKYLQLLEELNPAKTLVPEATSLVVILSGQSDFAHSELSEVQKTLLNYCQQYGALTLEIGFPYNQAHQFQEVKRAGIVTASIRNLLQFMLILFSPKYRRIVARHLQPLFSKAERILIIAQSSGLHMLKFTLPYLKLNEESELKLLALGPVVWGKFNDPRFNLITVKGTRDWLSYLLDRQVVNYQINCHHLDYCESMEVRKIIDGILKYEDKN